MPDQELIHRDVAGNQLHVGDFVAYAGLQWKAAALRIGQITALTQPKGVEEMKVEYLTIQVKYASASYNNKIRSGSRRSSINNLNKTMLIPEASISDEILDAIARCGT